MFESVEGKEDKSSGYCSVSDLWNDWLNTVYTNNEERFFQLIFIKH